MPPRQYVPSTWAGHTRSCRSAPIRPISSCVWTAPGRSTMTTRPVSSAVTGGTGRGSAVQPVQAPRVSRQQRVQVDAGEVADDDRGGGGGAYVGLVEGADGPGVDARRPSPRCPGAGGTSAEEAGKSSLESCLAARRGGLASSCGISSSRLRTSRSTSLSGEGRAPAARPRAGRAPWCSREAGTSRETRSAGVVGVRVERGAAALQLGGELLGGVLVGALGQGARHDRGDAVQARAARRPAGASRKTSTATTCWPGRWQRSTVRPLASTPRSGAGKAHGLGLARPGAGGGSPSSAGSVTGPPPRSRASASLRPRPRSSAVRLVHEHRAVVRAQPGLGDGLHLLGRDVEDALLRRSGRAAGRRTGRRSGTVRRRGRATVPSRSSHSRSNWAWARSISSAVGPSSAKRASSSSTARLDGRDLDAAGRLDVEPAQRGRAGQPQQAEAGRDGRAVAPYQPVVEARGLAAAEDGQRQVGRVALARAVVRQPVGGHQGARGDLLLDRPRAAARRWSRAASRRAGGACRRARGWSRSTSRSRRASARGRCRRRPTAPRCSARSRCGRTRARPPAWPRPGRPSSRSGVWWYGWPSG